MWQIKLVNARAVIEKLALLTIIIFREKCTGVPILKSTLAKRSFRAAFTFADNVTAVYIDFMMR